MICFPIFFFYKEKQVLPCCIEIYTRSDYRETYEQPAILPTASTQLSLPTPLTRLSHSKNNLQLVEFAFRAPKGIKTCVVAQPRQSSLP
jgi:hypothetical protein